jgi:two-component system phosphate regulon sensor histidine kinase PhoR
LEPVLIGDKVVGIFELKSTEKLVFNKQDLSLAQSVASSIGQALENALLYQKLKRHANDLEKTVAKRTVELQTERDRIKAILEALGEAVIVTDATGAIEYLNPAAISMTGFSEEDALGHNWRLLSDTGTWQQESNGSQEKLFEAILDTARSGEIWHGEVKNKRKVGTLYDALLTVAPLFHPEDPQQPIRFVAVQSDITSLKEAERIRTIHQENEKQAALDRLRHTFLSAINHELRTPLALMSQLIDMLEDSQLGELNAEQLDAVKSIDRQSKTLGQMVEGLTRVAAFLSKQETVRPVLGRLEPVFNNLIPLVEFKARSKEITVKNDIAPQLPPLRLDVKQLEEALIQIADNAIKFNEPGGQVQISAQADDDWVTISISDTGIGIDTELINRMWEIFEQGIDPVRRSQEGLGLGLVLAHYIIEAHNGSIEVETALGKGSTFMVRLPIAKRRTP